MPLDPADVGRLGDIQPYGSRAVRHLGALTQAEFIADEKTYDSIVRCLAIVGEAAWKLTKPFQQAHPEIPWILISGMRHRLIHDYGGADNMTVYRVARKDLPTLVTQVQAILAAGA